MMERAFSDLNKEGITSVGSDDFTAMPDKDYHNVIQAYQEIIADGEMTVRVYEQCLSLKKRTAGAILLRRISHRKRLRLFKNWTSETAY